MDKIKGIILPVYAFSFFLTLILHVTDLKADVLPTCQPYNFHFEYTECDADGGRWRVSVPKPGICTGGAPNPPVRGRDCSFTCAAGQYLDVEHDQDCKPCSPGFYSLGGGVRFDSWTQLPTGFSVKSEEFETREGTGAKSNCSKSGWQPRGDVIAAFTGECTAFLSYSAKLVRAGDVTFKYQYNDDNTIFNFYVQNDKCQAYHDRDTSVWPSITKDGEWKVHHMPLKSGLNILYWKVIGMSLHGSSKLKPVLIKEIEINGVAFTSECSTCSAGSYSEQGASVCIPCPVDTYSAKGASRCTPCNKDTEYADTGSEKCNQRPACTTNDYYSYNTACDRNKLTQKVYAWVEPHICRTDLAGAAQLPKTNATEPCPPCNLGMALNSTGSCVFCAKNSYSSNGICRECPVNTVPIYGLYYNWWNTLPPNMTTSCMSMDKNGCTGSQAWEPEGDYIKTGRGHNDDAYLMLSLALSGFSGNQGQEDSSKPEEYAEVTFVFETSCTRKCSFFFIQESPDDGAKVIKSWESTQAKQSFKFKVSNAGRVTYNWAFEKVSWEMDVTKPDSEKSLQLDYAIIHSINVTNTLAGGASECRPCPKGVANDGCIPCPEGFYIDKSSERCVQCPPNTAVRGRMMYGQESCQACGQGLITLNHASCHSDCKFKSEDGKDYDFSALKGAFTVNGAKLFTTSGTQYFHVFNISLCGSLEAVAACANNFTSALYNSGNDTTSNATHSNNTDAQAAKPIIRNRDHSVESFICRSTIIPPKNPAMDATLSAQPNGLGDIIVNVSSNHDNTTRARLNEKLKEAGWPINEDNTDVHFTYFTEEFTASCPNGRQTIVTLRCDVKERQTGTIELPPKCPDGTCDGCNFHIMWHSRYACPKCKDDDYDVVPGECNNGDQVVYYYPPKHCILSGTDDKPKTKHQSCPLIPVEIQIMLLVIAGLGILMCAVIVYCWKRNKSLEYKYMKLVHSGSKDGGELPAAETCALDENEDDEQFDQVKFKESKGKKLFNKLKSMAGKREKGRDYFNEDNPFESIKLTGGGKHQSLS